MADLVALASQTRVAPIQNRVWDGAASFQYAAVGPRTSNISVQFNNAYLTITAAINEDISCTSDVYQRLHYTLTTTCSALFTQTHVSTHRGLYSAPVNDSNDT